MAKARLVQQWAYLRHENTSSVVVIENLALRLGNLKKDFDGMLQSLAELRAAQHMTSTFEVSQVSKNPPYTLKKNVRDRTVTI